MHNIYVKDTFRYYPRDYSLAPQVLLAYRFLRKYFRILVSPELALMNRRRKFPFDFGDTAISTLSRLESQMANKPVIAGSEYLDKIWAIFGACDNIVAENYFDTFHDVINYYSNDVLGKYTNVTFYFKTDTCYTLDQLSRKNCICRNSMFSFALLLLQDLIINAGPDHRFFYDLFTNDYRDTNTNVDFGEWEKLRCKVLGRFGAINWIAKKPTIADYSVVKRKQNKNKVTFIPLYYGNRLKTGEKSYRGCYFD